MAEDSVNLERIKGQPQLADGVVAFSTGATTPTQPRSVPFARYWHEQLTSAKSPQQHRNPNHAKSAKLQPASSTSNNKVKSMVDMSIFQSPISSDAVTTIELLKTEPEIVVELQSSDEDEVVEVALPPKPTITIESSDDEPEVSDVAVKPQNNEEPEKPTEVVKKVKKKQKNKRRTVSASPVPSVVSSISDDFIRGDCAALNISRRPEEHNFDFNLHGADLIDSQSNNTLSQKTKKKKNKQRNKDKTPTSPRVEVDASVAPVPPAVQVQDQCFTTPRSKPKRKNEKSKSYSVSKQSIPDPDIYESDSNQSAPVDNVLETAVSGSSSIVTTVKPPEQMNPQTLAEPLSQIVDLASVCEDTNKEATPLEDNLVMGNVTGLEPCTNRPPSREFLQIGQGHGSLRTVSKVPPILHHQPGLQEHWDKHSVQQFSRSTCREEMERFYNESWGGENFDHVEILRSMSRDKSLWAIDPRDKTPSGTYKRRCHFCNHVGHGYERCWLKPRICHMCGSIGHSEPRCPQRMCLKCGSPNSIYSMSCRNCTNWKRVYCNICRDFGHPVKDCPDLWRRYHSTVENNGFLIASSDKKKQDDLFCSGCTRRGHLAHMCCTVPYSGLPLYSPFVSQYKPLYPPLPAAPAVSSSGRYFTLEQNGDETGFHNLAGQDTNQTKQNVSDAQPAKFAQKRLSGSNITPNTSKKRHIFYSETHNSSNTSKNKDDSDVVSSTTETRENVLQDCEVSNTSEVETVVTIYIEKMVMEELATREGSHWLVVTSAENRVEVTLEERPTALMKVKGVPADQEAFQAELKNWVHNLNKARNEKNLPIPNAKNNEIIKKTTPEVDFCKDIPHKKVSLIRMLNRAFAFLRSDLGDPKAIYKELTYRQIQHNLLLKKKVISKKMLSNSRTKINEILKILNMILVGQAGLADGSQHLKELSSLHQALIKYRKRELPLEMRQKIGEHYHFIFNSVAREDYVELMGKYYNTHTPKSQKYQINKTSDKEATQPKTIKKKLKMHGRKNIAANMHQCSNNTTDAMALANTNNGSASSKEYTIDQIQTFQKKLRKWNVRSQETDQWRNVLLTRLRKFQFQLKRRGLFQNQYIQLDKLMTEVKKFFGEL